MMDGDRANEVWERLSRGTSLIDLGLATVDGRIDLRGLVAPEPSTVGEFIVGKTKVKQLDKVVNVHGAHWANLDVSDGALESLRFFDCRIENCRFDRACCRDWRMWGTTIANTSFVGADLREAALGGVQSGKRNAFVTVDFTRADLRRTAHMSADMTDCTVL